MAATVEREEMVEETVEETVEQMVEETVEEMVDVVVVGSLWTRIARHARTNLLVDFDKCCARVGFSRSQFSR